MSTTIDDWLAQQRNRLLHRARHSPWLTLTERPGLLLEILLPHGNELFPGLTQTRKSWSFWLPPEDAPAGNSRTPSRPSTAASTLVVTGPGGETLDRQRLHDVLTHLHRQDERHQRL